MCYKVFLCKNCQRQSCKVFIVLTNRAKMIGRGRPLLPEILDQSDRVLAKSLIFDLFARSDSAVTPSEKTSVNSNMKSTTRFPMSLRWTSYDVPKPSKGWLKNAVSEIWTISCDISETVRDRMSLITYRKSHTGFRLVPTSMTLNDLEWYWTP